MSEDNAELLESLDFLRVSTPNIYGSQISKLIPKRHFDMLKSNAVEIYVGITAFGPRDQFVPIQQLLEAKLGNGYLQPDLSTVHALPWAEDKQRNHKIGSVICELLWSNGKPVKAHPRYVARCQLERLSELGYKLYSAFEPEFWAFKAGTLTPIVSGKDICKTSIQRKYEKYIMEADRQLMQAKIDMQHFNNEYGIGQLEMPLMPSYGIEASDKYFIFTGAMKEIGEEFDLSVSFMTKPLPRNSPSGCHFNYSVWHKDSGMNAFYDPTAADGLSQIARYWLGGLTAHAGALLAFCCPTVNCYRRLHQPWAPDGNYWDINDRAAAFRVKVNGERSTYFESRLSSSASCPYLVTAANVAAGIDGIKRKLEPVARGSRELGILPHTLEETLNLLEKDEILCEALGREFVAWFVQIKRSADLTVLRDVDIKADKEEDYAAEREQYFII